MKSFYITLMLSLTIHFSISAQAVSINSTGNPPDPSAILDVQSTNKGVLIPRVSTNQRINIPNPVKGLIVYDTSTASFWFHTGIDWVEITDNFHGLRDKDKDTQIQVEESPDEDVIRFDIGGVEAMVLDESTQGATLLRLSPDSSLIIGHNAGNTSIAGLNTILGYEAGQNNTTGNRNVFVGFRAGKNNGVLKNRNVLIGYEAGLINDASYNTMIGYQAGVANTTGSSNSFMGYGAGIENINGARNTFIGFGAGVNNETTNDNTYIGNEAGYFSTGQVNTFVGKDAGYGNRLGNQNTVIGAEAAGSKAPGRDMGHANAVVGFQAGYMSTSMAENVLMGFRAGFNMTSGANNVFMGSNTGYLSTTARQNVALGSFALRNNLTGNSNVAVGDSTLYNNTASGNVAVGNHAGKKNTSGQGNTFIGKSAGLSNLTANYNTMIGNSAGPVNTIGEYNVFLGHEAAYSNSSGNNNSFIGFAAGFRNTTGNKNIFLGNRVAEYNLAGSNNIAIGTSALTRNNNGSFNIAIGDLALGNPVQESTSIAENIAIGKNAGRGVLSNENIIIGNESGLNINGGENVLLGNEIEHYGSRNTYLGTGTSASIIHAPIEATAIGYGTTIMQDYSVIVGDPANYQNKVGIGTALPDARLHIEGQGFQALKVTQNGDLSMHIATNGTVIIDKEFLVNTSNGVTGYEMSVNGEIACEEILVQDDGAWPDYVFAEDYDLMSMDDLQSFLKENNHLPGIPSAAQVAEEGVKVGDMQKRLLEKIEELTLYILDLESRLQSLENK